MVSVKCSFCGIDSEDTRCALIIAGPGGVCICNDCVMKSVTIINDKYNDLWLEKARKERDSE